MSILTDTQAQARVVQNVYDFLCAAQGNWRNSLYLRCDGCRWEKAGACGGFLMAPGSDGYPHLLPASLVRVMTGRAPEPDECLGGLTVSRFISLYNSCLMLYTSGQGCPLLELMAVRP